MRDWEARTWAREPLTAGCESAAGHELPGPQLVRTLLQSEGVRKARLQESAEVRMHAGAGCTCKRASLGAHHSLARQAQL